MALVRATQQTALPTVRQLVGDLKKLAREAASAPALDNLVASLDALDAHGARRSLDVELILAGALSPEDAGIVATWIGSGFLPSKLQIAPGEQPIVDVPGTPLELRVQVRHLTSRLAQKAGAARAPIAVLVAPRPLALTADEKEQIDRAFDDRPQIVLLASTVKAPAAAAAPPAAAPPAAAPPAEGAPGEAAPPAEAVTAPDAADGAAPAEAAPAGPPSPADAPWFKEVEARAKAAGWSALSHKYVPDTTLQTRLGSAPWDQLHDLFRAHGIAVGLDSLSNVYDMVLEQVQDEMRVNKSVGQQKLAKLGGAKGGAAAAASPTVDLLADLKTRTQRLAAEFERGASDRLQDLLGQPAGLLVRETEQALGGLQELQLEKKSKTMGARVPAAFEEKVNKLIRERVGRHCAGDLVALNDLFRLIGQEFERTLAQAQGPPIVVQFRYLTDERVRRMLDMYGIFQSPYKGEMPNPGFGEYFASVRKYSMVLVMGASMFGMSAMLRQYREITVPITVLLVAFGTYSVATATRQQRVENLETQLEAARVGMRTEIRRIITDLQKQWTVMLKEFLNDQISSAVAEVDAALKESQGKKGGGDANPERDRVARQLATIEAAEKRIGASGKARETFVQAVAQIRGDLKGLMSGGGPPGMARPGMPGAARPGMPAVPARPGMPGAAARPAAAPNPALAEARAKMEAMKNKSAGGPAAAGAPAGGGAADFRARMAAAKAKPEADAAAPAEPKVSPADAFKAKMAAMKAAKAGEAGAAPVAAPAAAAPAAPPAAAEAPAAPPAAAPAEEPKPSAADAFKAKMAAMKAAKAGEAAAAAAPAAPATPPPPPAAAAPEVPVVAEPAVAAPAAAAPAAAAEEPKVNAADAFKAKMAAMKAAKAAEAAPAAAPPAPAAAEPAPVPVEAAPSAAPAAEAKVSAAEAFKAKMAAMKAAKAAPAVEPSAAPAAEPAAAGEAKVSAADAFKAKMAAMKAAKAAAVPAVPEPAPAAAAPAPEPAPPEPAPAPAPAPAEQETHFAETMEIRAIPEVKSPERAE